MTKGRIKQLAVKWGLMMLPVWAVLIWSMVYHPQRAQAEQPPVYQVLWFPNCSPAWAGGTTWPEGIIQGTKDGFYFPTSPCCGCSYFLPTWWWNNPQLLATNTAAQLVIDIDTNFCGQGDIELGFACTQQLVYFAGIPKWITIKGSTNYAVIPNGSAEAIWNITTEALTNYFGNAAQIPVLSTHPYNNISCPGGGTGGQ